jgi:origin recognition complex subunit 1
MFVSGVPGTGKTATIRAVAKHLVSELASGNLPGFLFVEINGMALTSPYQAYSDLWHAVSEREVSSVPPMTSFFDWVI